MTVPEYTILAATSVVVVVLLETRVWRTGLLRRPAWWVSLGICLFFMVLVNGWLTKLSAPVVLYDDARRLLPRVPWDIPMEDYLFGFSLITLVTLLWIRAAPDEAPDDPSLTPGAASRRRRPPSSP